VQPGGDQPLLPGRHCRQSIFAEMKKKFSQAECAAEEPRVLCIIQDTTNSRRFITGHVYPC
uniref:Uncharacterized protein n=1 Tax=Serinus canaria TaxID=9135 RepID=A0A8C9MT68_SERCA